MLTVFSRWKQTTETPEALKPDDPDDEADPRGIETINLMLSKEKLISELSFGCRMMETKLKFSLPDKVTTPTLLELNEKKYYWEETQLFIYNFLRGVVEHLTW